MAEYKANDFITAVEKPFKNAPALPENLKDLLVRIAPWFALIFGIFGLLGSIGAVGFSPLAVFGGEEFGILLFVKGALAIVSSILLLVAFSKLNKRQFAGWRLLFWVQALGLISGVIGVSVASILWNVVFSAVGFYLLFQIKSHYK